MIIIVFYTLYHINMAKTFDSKIQELEKERLQTLRERAQEAVLQNLDDQVEQINKKFDKRCHKLVEQIIIQIFNK